MCWLVCTRARCIHAGWCSQEEYTALQFSDAQFAVMSYMYCKSVQGCDSISLTGRLPKVGGGQRIWIIKALAKLAASRRAGIREYESFQVMKNRTQKVLLMKTHLYKVQHTLMQIIRKPDTVP